jgi:hypothetical protein
MEKRKQLDERKDVGRRRKKERYERNVEKKASGNIQTQNRVYEGHPRPQDSLSAIHYAPSATPIYPSNAKKLRTRE